MRLTLVALLLAMSSPAFSQGVHLGMTKESVIKLFPGYAYDKYEDSSVTKDEELLAGIKEWGIAGTWDLVFEMDTLTEAVWVASPGHSDEVKVSAFKRINSALDKKLGKHKEDPTPGNLENDWSYRGCLYSTILAGFSPKELTFSIFKESALGKDE